MLRDWGEGDGEEILLISVTFFLLASNLITPHGNQSSAQYMFHFLRKLVIVISYFVVPSSS